MSLCVEHMACCLFGAMCSHVDCLSPPILLLIIVSVAPAVSPSLPRLSPYIVSLCLQSCADPLSFVCHMLHVSFVFDCTPVFACMLVFLPFGVVFLLQKGLQNKRRPPPYSSQMVTETEQTIR